MEYICLECGAAFESGEERHWRESHGEEMTGCPKCGGGFAEAVRCRVCYEAHLEDDLYNGVCEDCLLDSMTADTLADYLRDGKMEEEFYMEVLFTKAELRGILRDAFLQRTVLEWEQRKTDALKKCRDYVNDDDCGLADYGEWCAQRRKRGRNGKP